ncbi:hypothetical protein EVS84_14605 [Pseudomonas koreensis]|uniref:Uncharacterized protein n=2 Tax=Pseudomonas TaxID=286 RepID=A0A4Q4L2P5_9PSED|nr:MULTISPECIES: hypothetical protein [Pseudomonas]MDM8191018.1 hypothetical protein [Pseudomonas fluorescens]MDP8572263.1 hypothetical protein [Pseudomonas iranensis]RYM41128.1 hypothetical protein EVS84_14605 [Pseudomonas koreensis]
MIREDHAFFVIGDWEHIRCYRNGCLWFRFYSVSLFKTSTDPVTKPAEGAKRSKANAKARSKDRSLRQLLVSRTTPEQVGYQAAFASRSLPQKQKQSSAAARGKAAPLNNERKLECS